MKRDDQQRRAFDEAVATLTKAKAANRAALATCGDDEYVLAWKHHLAVRLVDGKPSAAAPRLATVFPKNTRFPRITNGAGEEPTLVLRRDAIAADTTEIERTIASLSVGRP